jgi:hypothetical protein
MLPVRPGLLLSHWCLVRHRLPRRQLLPARVVVPDPMPGWHVPHVTVRLIHRLLHVVLPWLVLDRAGCKPGQHLPCLQRWLLCRRERRHAVFALRNRHLPTELGQRIVIRLRALLRRHVVLRDRRQLVVCVRRLHCRIVLSRSQRTGSHMPGRRLLPDRLLATDIMPGRSLFQCHEPVFRCVLHTVRRRYVLADAGRDRPKHVRCLRRRPLQRHSWRGLGKLLLGVRGGQVLDLVWSDCVFDLCWLSRRHVLDHDCRKQRFILHGLPGGHIFDVHWQLFVVGLRQLPGWQLL